MKKSLPEQPDLGQLKRQAKELLNAAREGQAEALARMASTQDKSGGGTAQAAKLVDAQRVIAREHGFASWVKLKLHVETRTEAAAEARLIAAALAGDAAGVSALLAERPALARRSIHAAAALGDAASIGAWLTREAALAQAPGGPRGWVPLLYLCFARSGSGDAMRAQGARHLLEAGADANASWIDPAWPDSPESALYGATGVNNFPGLARVLLKAGARTQDGESCYHAAEYFHRESLEVLAEFGADFSARQEPWGNTPLYFLLGGFNAASSLRNGIRWVLEHGVDPNVACTEQKETALHRAAAQGWDAEIVELLLSKGADPAVRRADGRTPLALAVRSGSVEAERVLRGAGAADEVSATDRFLGACLRADETAARAQLADRSDLLMRLTAGERRLVQEAAKREDAAALRLMLALGFDPAVLGAGQESALHIAAWHGRADAVRALIGAGVPLELPDARFQAPPFGWCAHGSLYCAAAATGDYAQVAELLIAAGVRPPKGTKGSPAVMAAIKPAGR